MNPFALALPLAYGACALAALWGLAAALAKTAPPR